MQGIYAIVCLANAKIYVGATDDLERRQKDHFLNLRNNRHINTQLQTDFNYFGESQFQWQILEEVTEISLLFRKENEWMEKVGHKYNVNKFVELPKLDDTIIERFWSKVDKKGDTECWEWKDSCTPYGKIKISGKKYIAHRLSYCIHNGDFDCTMLVLHICNNKKCVNPNHLKLGTHQENMRGMANDGLSSGKLNFKLATEIRNKYQEIGKRSTKYVRLWLKEVHNIELGIPILNALLNNRTYKDANYVPITRKIGGWSRQERDNCKINQEIANYIRKLYQYKMSLKNIVECVFDTFGIRLSTTTITDIYANQILPEADYIYRSRERHEYNLNLNWEIVNFVRDTYLNGCRNKNKLTELVWDKFKVKQKTWSEVLNNTTWYNSNYNPHQRKPR